MAQSPSENTDSSQTDSYKLGWKAVNTLMKEGSSWSGHEANCVFLNTGEERFANVSGASGLDFTDDARGLAVCDWNQDGALDLWIANRSAPQTRLVLNQSKKRHFVSLRLRGITCNRDAIGARVELFPLKDDAGAPEGRHIRTLHGADGFLSQSSKWIHFGLGDAKGIERVVVRWPGGESEEFSGLDLDQHYQLVQGSGQAEKLSITPRGAQLKPSVMELPEATAEARIPLGFRLPFPALDYEDLEGETSTFPSGKESLLVNVWGVDCAPCVAELGEFERRREELQAKGLSVIALNIDKTEDRPAARAMLERLDWNFDAGFANPILLDALDYIQRKMTYRQQSLPLPTSFLVSPAGLITVLYRGPVDVEVLLEDLELLDASADEVRAAATPLPGQWLYQADAGADLSLRLANELFEKDLLDAAGEVFLLVDAPEIKSIDLGTEVLADYQSMAIRFAYGMIQTDRHDLAQRVVARMLNQQPDALQGVLKLATTLEEKESFRDAEVMYRAVLDQRDTQRQARFGLASALLRQDRAKEALPLLEALAIERPKNPNAHYLLACAFDALGQDAKGDEHIKRAIKLRPQNKQYSIYSAQREL